MTEGARARARREVMAELTASARRQLAEVGAAQLSLRAVARDLGMVSSAVYRYVASRDELLTLLIVDAYDALGEAAERASAAAADEPPARRWVATACAIRRWALEHPHEYLLVFGTPVPGYSAPAETTESGTRASLALLGIVADAIARGLVADVDLPPVPPDLAAEMDALASTIRLDVPADVLLRALAAWSQLFGIVTFELTNQTRGMVEHHEALFEAAAATMAAVIGLES